MGVLEGVAISGPWANGPRFVGPGVTSLCGALQRRRTDNPVLPGSPRVPLVELFENRDYRGSTHFFFDVGHGNYLAYFDFPGLDLGAYREVVGGTPSHRYFGKPANSGNGSWPSWRRPESKPICERFLGLLCRARWRAAQLLSYPLNDMYGTIVGRGPVGTITRGKVPAHGSARAIVKTEVAWWARGDRSSTAEVQPRGRCTPR